jgi:2-keto-3-deoxy-L-rhamnonate aldolase RhmA
MVNEFTPQTLKERLRRQERTFGGWVQLPSPDAAEIVAAAGFEWVVVDLEHGGIDRSAMVPLIRAIQGRGAVALTRLMAGDALLARQALDAGASGVIVPHVSDPDQYAAFVEACTWPPAGSRSIGFFRANDYGRSFDDYASEALDPIVVPMVESRAGLDNLEAVLSAARADAVLIGPYDLSASLGAPGDFASNAYRQAEDLVLATCARYGVAAGIHDVTPTSASIADKTARGYTFIACGMDTVFLSAGAAAVLNIEEVRNAGQT